MRYEALVRPTIGRIFRIVRSVFQAERCLEGRIELSLRAMQLNQSPELNRRGCKEFFCFAVVAASKLPEQRLPRLNRSYRA